MRLIRYLAMRFTRDTGNILVVIAFIGFLSQMIRYFDLVTGKGQGLADVILQAGLVLPVVIQAVLPISMMLGLARSLRHLSATRELHIIHGAGRLTPLFAAFALFILGGTVLVGGLAHFVEPLANRASTIQNERISTDIVARAGRAGAYVEVTDGVTFRIEGRDPDGTLRGFFLHDDRAEDRSQTFYADTAVLDSQAEAVNVVLSNGVVQYRNRESGRLSSVSFSRYLINLEDLSRPAGFDARQPALRTSVGISEALFAGKASQAWTAAFHSRFGLMLQPLALGTLVLFALGFPSGKRRSRWLPPELWLLTIAIASTLINLYPQQSAAQNPGMIPFIYVAPLLPLLLAAVFAWRRLRKARAPAPPAKPAEGLL
ncbi:LptF/LptG family permease [Cucumibacter marinus]|uniref:LptF/LptG family permease n=1 Tax=Cucumibacter marinus TaxID=1121252 RepID=UPI000413A59D|nr:LptF/LptG family permease [Cucumibacter marinus]